MSVKTKLTAIAEKIRILLGITGTMGLDAMASNLDTVQNAVNTQSDLIGSVAAALSGKAVGSGGVDSPTGTVTFTENGGPHDVKGVAYVVIDVHTGTPETWTCILENGNTVEKEVYVE